MNVDTSKRVCSLIIELLLIEVNKQVQYVTPYKVGGVERKPIIARKISKTIDEEHIENRLTKGSASLQLTTMFIGVEDGHRVEVEVRLWEREQKGRIRVRAYKGNKVVNTVYYELSKYEISGINENRVYDSAELRLGIERVVNRFIV